MHLLFFLHCKEKRQNQLFVIYEIYLTQHKA